MQRPFRIFAFLALIVPTFLLGGNLLLRMSALENTTDTMRLPLGGYDPVSVLHGHYIRITFDREAILSENTCKGPSCCLCFYQNEARAWKADRISCVAQKEKVCARTLEDTGFLSKSYQYYVDEREAPRLDALLRDSQRALWDRREQERKRKKDKPPSTSETQENSGPQFSMETVVSDRGEIVFKMLYIDDKPWIDYLRDLGNK